MFSGIPTSSLLIRPQAVTTREFYARMDELNKRMDRKLQGRLRYMRRMRRAK